MELNPSTLFHAGTRCVNVSIPVLLLIEIYPTGAIHPLKPVLKILRLRLIYFFLLYCGGAPLGERRGRLGDINSRGAQKIEALCHSAKTAARGAGNGEAKGKVLI